MGRKINSPQSGGATIQASWVIDPATDNAETGSRGSRVLAVTRATAKALAAVLVFAALLQISWVWATAHDARISAAKTTTIDTQYFGTEHGQRGCYAQLVLAVSEGHVEDEELRIVLADAISSAKEFEPVSESELRAYSHWAWFAVRSERADVASENLRQITELITAVDQAVGDVVNAMGSKAIELLRDVRLGDEPTGEPEAVEKQP